MKLNYVQLVLGIFLLAVTLVGCQTSSEPTIIAIRPADSPERAATIAADPDLQAGEAAYNLRCAHCHGYAGEGQLAPTIPNTQQLGMHTVPPHDATGHTWQHPTQLLRQVILQGIQNPLDQFAMPSFDTVVNDEEIDQLISYISLWWTDEQRVWQSQVTARRAELDAPYEVGSE